jgi:hypothetical protein
MNIWLGLPFTILLVLATLLLSEDIGIPLVPLLIIITSFWTAWDSSKIGLIKYKSGISYKPVVLFFLVLTLWIVGFPWYLHMRHKIKRGAAHLKPLSKP